MSKDPVGFLSYVRDDDAHEHGRLTQFCDRLAGEVRMQSGEKFDIFQDRNDIAWGQQWKERIEESIDAATFLIPIITPRFFKSPPCRDELERFLDREKRLKRADLILPVYYVDWPTLNDEKKRKTDPLAIVIAERQYADWRELRFEPLTAPQIGKMLANLAKQIVDALERQQPQRNSTKARGKNRRNKIRTATKDRASAESPEQLESQAQSVEAIRRSVAKTEPTTLIVDALHRGDHPTLRAAIAAAQPGNRILVRPGLYREGIVITKPVEIIGDGELGEVVLEAKGRDVIRFEANMGRIANLTLRQVGGGEWYCVDIGQGRLDLEGCDITSQSLSCVGIHGGADPRLRRNRIHDGRSAGVFIYENGQGTLEDNDIFGSTHSNVSICEGSNPTLRRNRIHDGKVGGVNIYENGQGILEDNDIFANANSGVQIHTGGNPTLRRNRIHDGKAGGVHVYENGQGILEDNEIFANARSGVAIKTGGNPTLRRNRIHDGKQTGVFVHENGRGMLEDNEIFANAYSGVAIKEGGRSTLRRNRISSNTQRGIYVHDNGGGVFEDNDLRGNTKGAWNISPDCEKNVKRTGNLE